MGAANSIIAKKEPSVAEMLVTFSSSHQSMTRQELIHMVLALQPSQIERVEYLKMLQHPELVFLVYSMVHHGYVWKTPSAPKGEF